LSGSIQKKKKHHFIPVTYLKRFTNNAGLIFTYRKDTPEIFTEAPPERTGFINHYYRQPIPGGGWDHNTIEDAFQEIEGLWTPAIKRLRAQEPFSPSQLVELFAFIAALHVRVPSTRDAVEQSLSEQVKRAARDLDASGYFPPKPEGLEDILDHTEIAIDPHQSLHAMDNIAKTFENVIDILGFKIIKNETPLPLITTDNPVVFFNPNKKEEKVLPYRISISKGDIEFFTPLDTQHLLYGHTRLHASFLKDGISYTSMRDKYAIKRINRYLARFAYQSIFTSTHEHAPLIKRHSIHSPVIGTPPELRLINGRPDVDSDLLIKGMVFGDRRTKPKWAAAR